MTFCAYLWLFWSQFEAICHYILLYKFLGLSRFSANYVLITDQSATMIFLLFTVSSVNGNFVALNRSKTSTQLFMKPAQCQQTLQTGIVCSLNYLPHCRQNNLLLKRNAKISPNNACQVLNIIPVEDTIGYVFDHLLSENTSCATIKPNLKI